jgi:hypothetical protein
MITNFDLAREHLGYAEQSLGEAALREALIGVGYALLATVKNDRELHIVDYHGRHWLRDLEYSDRVYRRTEITDDPRKGIAAALGNAWELMGGSAELYAPDDCPVCTVPRTPVAMTRVTTFEALEALA